MTSSTENTSGPIHIGPKRKIALVCSGGATKAGAFHIGVALALQEHGFKFYGGLSENRDKVKPPGQMEISTYVGSSAGSVISSVLAAGYSIENIAYSFLNRRPADSKSVNWNPKAVKRMTYQQLFNLAPTLSFKSSTHSKRFTETLKSLLRTRDLDSLLHLRWLKIAGIFSIEGVEKYMREEILLSNRFQDYLADLFIVATQLNHSRKVVFGKYKYQPPPHDVNCRFDNDVAISDACAASSCVPGLFSPYFITHSNKMRIPYIDGEIRDTLSTHVAADSGADLIISSYTHQPYHIPPNSEMLYEQGIAAVIVQAIYLLIEQKINTHIYNRKLHQDTIEKVYQYCKKHSIPEDHQLGIRQLLEEQLHHRTGVHNIYIHPDPDDKQMIFGDHFSLSPKRMAELMMSGYRAGINTLKNYVFADCANTSKLEPSPVIYEVKKLLAESK